jgi:hypothetical protein
MARERETAPGANTVDAVVLMAVSLFVSVLAVERRNGSIGRTAPANHTNGPKE